MTWVLSLLSAMANTGRGDSQENAMADQKTEPKKNPQSERAGQKQQEKHEKDRASYPERREKQDPQFDPSHINED
jgi:hypothetical protein